MTKRLIEVEGAFPLREVSEVSRREKSVRHGHISTLHIWWARRPLAASRATAFAALMPDPADDAKREQIKKLIAKMAPWEAVKNTESDAIKQARQMLREVYGEHPPKVLDCFAGGGSIPLEALRLGCETYALDYNPVAVLILKAVLEYPQKFGRSMVVPDHGGTALVESERRVNPLLEAVKKWGRWVLEEARKELEPFYPNHSDGSIPVGYIWARTLPCQDAACGTEIPLMRQTWLAKKDNKKVAIKLVADKQEKRVDAVIVKDDGIDFDPDDGTVRGAVVTCPVCGGTIDDDTTRKLFRAGKAGQRMTAVVLRHSKRTGKTYRLPTDRDLTAYEQAVEGLEAKRQRLWQEWGMDPVPDELLYAERPSPNARGLSAITRYEMNSWSDLFDSRQQLALLTFVENVRKAYEQISIACADPALSKAAATYLALATDGLAGFLSRLCRWDNSRENVKHIFARQALPMLWDFVEANPFSGASGGAQEQFSSITKVLPHLSGILDCEGSASTVLHGSATTLPWPDDFFDAVLTDPPYYDNVPYSDLSDFFYIWLKRTICDLHPDLLSTPLTPKTGEIVWHQRHGDTYEAGKTFYEQMITEAFREICRVLKPNGISVIVFAHTSTEGWETVINALIDAGLYLTASLPIQTEMGARVRAQENASLASSVYMVCRKRVDDKVGSYRDVVEEMRQEIPKALERFWETGISGADFLQSAIGPAVAIFGCYKNVVKQDGTQVSVNELLEEVRRIVVDYALKRVLERIGADAQAMGGIDPVTRFYLLWRWTFGGSKVKVPFDDALRLARPTGVELAEARSQRGVLRAEKDKVRVVGPQDRASDRRFLDQNRYTTVIDALHRAVIAWQVSDSATLAQLQAMYGNSQVFWWVAQAIAEVLPQDDEERKLLHGFLQLRQRSIRSTDEPEQLSMSEETL
jgi:putative DNA methylase